MAEEKKVSRPESTEEELEALRKAEEPIEEEPETYAKITTQSSVVRDIIDGYRDADREVGTSYKEGDRTLPPKSVGDPLSEDEISKMDRGIQGFGYGLEQGGLAVGNVALDFPEDVAQLIQFDEFYSGIQGVLEMSGVEPYNIMLNLPYVKGYDPSKPNIFFDDTEYLPPGKRWPDLEDPEHPAYIGLQMLGEIWAAFRGAKFGVASSGLKDKYGLGTDFLTSLIIMKPGEERLSNFLVDWAQNSPAEFMVPFFKFMASDEDNTEAEEYMLAGLESNTAVMSTLVIAKALFYPYLLAKKVIRLRAQGAAEEVIERMVVEETNKIIKFTDEGKMGNPKGQKIWDEEIVPYLNESKRVTTRGTTRPKDIKLSTDKPSDEAILKSVEINDGDIIQFIKDIGEGKYVHKEWRRILNSERVRKLGSGTVIDALARKLEASGVLAKADPAPMGTLKPKGTGISLSQPFSKTRQLAREEYKKIYGADDLKLMSEQLELPEARLYEMLAKDLDSLKGVNARLIASKAVLTNMAIDLKLSIIDIVKGPGGTNAVNMTRIKLKIQEFQDLITLRGEVSAETARAVTGARINEEFLNKETRELLPDSQLTLTQINKRDEILLQQVYIDGLDETKLQQLILGLEDQRFIDQPLNIIPTIQQAMAHAKNRTWAVFMEIFRGKILWSKSVMLTSVYSGIQETLWPPLRDMVGTGFGLRDRETFVRATLRFRGLARAAPKAAIMALKSLVHEKNYLDPRRTLIHDLAPDRQQAIKVGVGNKFYQISEGEKMWHPANWLAAAINGGGMYVRKAIRVIGSIDEWTKQINYGSYVYAELMMARPENWIYMTKHGKSTWFNREYAKYFGPEGQAVNKKGLEYAQKAVFQETLEPGSFGNWLNQGAKRWGVLEAAMPINRTPANVMRRISERTPVVSLARKEVRRKWLHGTTEERTEVMGDLIIGAPIVMGALYYVSEDLFTGSGPTDHAQFQLWKAAGYKPYSIRVGGEWQPYDRFSPFVAPVMWIASMWENSYKYKGHEEILWEEMLVAMGQSLSDQYFTRGLFDLFKGIERSITTGTVVEPLIAPLLTQALGIGKLTEEIAMKSRGYQYHLSFRNVLERLEADYAIVTGDLPDPNKDFKDRKFGVKHFWLTGEPYRDDRYNVYPPGSGKAPKEPSRLMVEMLKMGKNIAAPTDRIEKDFRLNGKQFAELNKLVGTTEIEGLTLVEQLDEIMDADWYQYTPTRFYEDGAHNNRRVLVFQAIINAYKQVAMAKLRELDPEVDAAFQKSLEEESWTIDSDQEGTIPSSEEKEMSTPYNTLNTIKQEWGEWLNNFK